MEIQTMNPDQNEMQIDNFSTEKKLTFKASYQYHKLHIYKHKM